MHGNLDRPGLMLHKQTRSRYFWWLAPGLVLVFILVSAGYPQSGAAQVPSATVPSSTLTVTPTMTVSSTVTVSPTLAVTSTLIVSPTQAVSATLPSATATVSPTLSTTTLAASSDSCLPCHGPVDKLIKAAPKFVMPDGTKINPHVRVDFLAKKPHEPSDGVVDCVKCHAPHPIPPTSAQDLSNITLDYCFKCHHQEDFRPCSTCH
jgi:hypothetical protein